MDSVDVIVVGAGVVGLAVGKALAEARQDTMIIERRRKFGEETSSRNSCVVHSGIYYPTGSLKAQLCVRGRELLYAFSADQGVAHWRCGKLIVAQSGQVSALEALHAKGLENGVTDLRLMDSDEASTLEPEVRCAAAVFSPSTGIIDVHQLMTAMLGQFEAHGGVLALNSTVQCIRPRPGGFEVNVCSGDVEITVRARRVVNSAGLDAVALSRRIEGYPSALVPDAYLAKGNYFSCRTRPFRHLVYPMPNDAGLGIHATLDLDGTVRFGPDVEWVDTVDYEVDAGRAEDFYASIHDYWPALTYGDLMPAYAGIRPKVVGPGQRAADFMIVGPRDHGLPGLVNMMGIESPGLTAAIAIGDYVRSLLGDDDGKSEI